MPRTHLGLFALSLLATWLLGPGAALYWDSFGYVTQSLNGHVGGLLLGRPLFVFASQRAVSLALTLGLSAWHAEPLLRALWNAFSALSAPLMASLALGLGLTPRAALLAGALVALSPALAHTRDAVLTDGPALTLLLASILATTRRAAFSAGLWLGLATATREPTAAFALVHITLFDTRKSSVKQAISWLSGFTLGLGLPVLWAALHEPAYLASLRQWIAAMREEQRRFPFGARDVGMYLVWLVTLGPSALCAAALCVAKAVVRLRVPREVWRVVVPSAVILASLARYQDISYSPRYLVAAFVCALVLPAAVALDVFARDRARLALVLLSLALPFCAAPVVRARQRPLLASFEALPAALLALPPDAVIVTGQLCPAVHMLREEARHAGVTPRPAWIPVCPGWRWPDDLAASLARYRREGHPVVLDLRASSWLGARQNLLRRQMLDDPRVRTEAVVWR